MSMVGSQRCARAVGGAEGAVRGAEGAVGAAERGMKGRQAAQGTIAIALATTPAMAVTNGATQKISTDKHG